MKWLHPLLPNIREDIVNKDRCSSKLHETEVIFFFLFEPARSPELPKLRQQPFVGFEGLMSCEKAGGAVGCVCWWPR